MPDSEKGKIISPEQLNDYIHVTSPGVWLILSSVLIFLTGFVFWILTGRLEVSFSSYIYNNGEVSLAFVSPNNALRLKKGTAVRIIDSGIRGTVEEIAAVTTPYREIIEHIGEANALMMGIHEGDKLIQVAMNIKNAPENISRALYVVDMVRPVSFLLK